MGKTGESSEPSYPRWVLSKLDKIYQEAYELRAYTRDPTCMKIIKLCIEMAQRFSKLDEAYLETHHPEKLGFYATYAEEMKQDAS